MSRVLIVEGDAALRDALQRILQRANCVALAAASIETATALLTSESIDAVVLDLDLPGADSLRSDGPTAAPIIGITAGTSVASTIARRLEAVALLTKPFTAHRIVSVVAAATATHFLSPRSALVVIATTATAEPIIQHLNAADVSVDWAPTAATAHVLATEHRYDIVVTTIPAGDLGSEPVEMLNDLRTLLPAAAMLCVAPATETLPGWVARVTELKQLTDVDLDWH